VKNEVKNVQTAVYDGARTVLINTYSFLFFWYFAGHCRRSWIASYDCAWTWWTHCIGCDPRPSSSSCPGKSNPRDLFLSRLVDFKWYFVTKIVLTYCEKNCSSIEKIFKAEGRKFAKILRSLEQFVQTVKGQNNFC
jgi:hypothetical protein